jgi:hypothetical protein
MSGDEPSNLAIHLHIAHQIANAEPTPLADMLAHAAGIKPPKPAPVDRVFPEVGSPEWMENIDRLLGRKR